MATKEHAGIRKLAETLQLISTKGLAGTEQFNETEAELNRVLGPILEAASDICEVHGEKHPTSCIHKLATALEKFNQGE